MNRVIVLLSLLISGISNAADLTGTLDLSHLAEKTNGGQYLVKVSPHILEEAEIVISQKIASGPVPRCKTEVTVEVGAVTLLLTDKENPQVTHQLVQALVLRAIDYALDETCPDKNFVTSPFMHYDAFLQLNDAITLKYSPPVGFGALKAKFSVFPFGYDAKLVAVKNPDGRYMALDLEKQMAAQLNRGYTDGLQFEVRATKQDDAILFGVGFITLK